MTKQQLLKALEAIPDNDNDIEITVEEYDGVPVVTFQVRVYTTTTQLINIKLPGPYSQKCKKIKHLTK